MRKWIGESDVLWCDFMTWEGTSGVHDHIWVDKRAITVDLNLLGIKNRTIRSQPTRGSSKNMSAAR